MSSEIAFDAILMDIEMPVMNGLEAAALMRERGINCPILALTGHAMDLMQQKIVTAGFSGQLTKPFTRDALQAILGEVLAN